jgi:hypothetical protein
VVERQAEADRLASQDPRDDAAFYAESLKGLDDAQRANVTEWVRKRIGYRAPTRAELLVLVDMVFAADE